jgi:hypothetical protein
VNTHRRRTFAAIAMHDMVICLLAVNAVNQAEIPPLPQVVVSVSAMLNTTRHVDDDYSTRV